MLETVIDKTMIQDFRGLTERVAPLVPELRDKLDVFRTAFAALEGKRVRDMLDAG